MAMTAIALLTLLGSAPLQDETPRVETRSEVRIITSDGEGPGRLDADGDGVVTREEFSAPLGDAFDRLDADHDGRLSTQELAARRGGPGDRVILRDGPGGPGVHVFTTRLDGPGGPGGDHEVFTIRRGGPEGGPPPGGPGPSRVFVRRFGGPDGPGEMDRDGDGKVSQAEFLAPLIEAFGRMDADGDGFLDEGEGSPPPPPAA
jgi:hypothetical protein